MGGFNLNRVDVESPATDANASFVEPPGNQVGSMSNRIRLLATRRACTQRQETDPVSNLRDSTLSKQATHAGLKTSLASQKLKSTNKEHAF